MYKYAPYLEQKHILDLSHYFLLFAFSGIPQTGASVTMNKEVLIFKYAS